MYVIDSKNRKVIIDKSIDNRSRIISNQIVLNEFDDLKKKFLDGTQDKYDCELVLLEVNVLDAERIPTGNKELKAYAKRKGVDMWLMNFNEEDYEL